MKRLKKYIKSILGIIALEETVELLKKENLDLKKDNNNLRRDYNNLRDYAKNSEVTQGFTNQNLRKELKAVQDLFGVSIDVSSNDYDRSWAVVSIGGKRETLHFYDLGNSEIKAIRGFLKPFHEAGIPSKQIMLDMPPGMKKNMLYGY